MQKISRSSKEPFYLQVERILKKKILKGEFKPDDLLPSERELCDIYGVSKITVRQSLKNLTQGGYVSRVPGVGTYVRNFREEKGEVKTIKIIAGGHLSTTERSFYLETLKGIEEVKDDYQLNFVGKVESRDRFFEIIKETKVDGLLIVTIDITLTKDDLLLLKREADIPFVILYTHIYEPGLYSVFTDLRLGTAKLTEHLVGLGHRVIAFLGGFATPKGDVERIEGYKLILEKHGIRYDKNLVRWAEYDHNKIKEELEVLLNLSPRPSAILAADDTTAADIINKLRTKRIRVPEDMAVVGYDDLYLASVFHPSITTVNEPMFEVGYRGMSLLKNLISGLEPEESQIILKPELVIRESCGAGLLKKKEVIQVATVNSE